MTEQECVRVGIYVELVDEVNILDLFRVQCGEVGSRGILTGVDNGVESMWGGEMESVTKELRFFGSESVLDVVLTRALRHLVLSTNILPGGNITIEAGAIVRKPLCCYSDQISQGRNHRKQ